MQRVIITGATSFIGIHLINGLVKEGCEIYAVVRKSSAKTVLLPASDNVKIIELEMEEYGRLSDVIKEPCDVYFSLAWNGTRGAERLVAEKQEENYKYSMEALSAVKNIGCKKVISAGSQAEYGFMEDRISENSVCKPNTEYGKWKLKYYEDGMDFCKMNGMSFKEPRFFSLYGEDDNDKTMVLSILNDMIEDKECKLTKCIQLWDFLYIDDAVDGLLKLMSMECADGAYNFGSGDIRPLKEFVLEMYEIIKSRSNLLFGAVPYPPTGMVNVCPDISKMKKQTGWYAKTTFAEGIQKIIDYRQTILGK